MEKSFPKHGFMSRRIRYLILVGYVYAQRELLAITSGGGLMFMNTELRSSS